jgi:predicted kinase
VRFPFLKSPTLHLICGLPGSGKTTLARAISQKTGSIRFTPDEWIRDIWAKEAETTGNNYRDQIEALQWNLAKQLLQIGKSVIIDWGTWGRSEREKLRDEARGLGAKVTFYYLRESREELKKRILARNKRIGPLEFYIGEDEIETFLDQCIQAFQIPTAEELATYDLIG